jgi:hypothetical protein
MAAKIIPFSSADKPRRRPHPVSPFKPGLVATHPAAEKPAPAKSAFANLLDDLSALDHKALTAIAGVAAQLREKVSR